MEIRFIKLGMSINKEFLKNAGIFALFLLGFWVISLWYLSPATDGKVLVQGDMQQVKLMKSVADSTIAKTGIQPNWNDRVFSGMPSSLISGIPQGSLMLKYRVLEIFGLVKAPFSFLFLAMLSMFVLLITAKVDRFLAAAGAIGYAFMTFSISSYEAGHITKVLAMDVMPGVIAGLLLLSQRKYIFGGITVALFFGMMINYFHYQIAYYTGIVVALYFIVELITAIRQKEVKSVLMSIGITALAMGIGAITCIGKISDTMQYANATMRGGSEVASEVPAGGPKQQVNAKGLDIDYAFSWSYGIDETLTLLVPRYKGGSSDEPVPENEFGAERLPTYFGDLQFTSGPIYMGAALMFLFVFSVVFAFQWKKNDPENQKAQLTYKIMLFSLLTFVVSMIMSWGRHFFINEILFDYLPYYNKFRTPMMTLVMAQVVVPFFGLFGLYQAMTNDFGDGFAKKLIRSAIVVAVVLMGVVMLGTSMSDFVGASDKEIAKSSGREAVDVIRDMRAKIVWADIWRSLMFVIVAVVMAYAAIKKQLKPIVIAAILVVTVGFDMISVSNRYLNDSNWKDAEDELTITPTKADEMVMQDNKDGARVFDLRYNPFNDNHAAPFHKNVGGYHPAKLSRYQDIISYCITPNGGQLSSDYILKNNALDMLNCRYVLTMSQNNQKEDVIPRTTNLGHAWFVDSVMNAASAKEALTLVNSVNIRNTAVVESKDAKGLTNSVFKTDSTAKVQLVKYSTDTLEYASHNSQEGLAVFSEVYYNEKNGGWQVLIDGKPAEAHRVNYILRSVLVPAGDHKIVWQYVPTDRGTYFTMETVSSGLILILLLVMLFRGATGKSEESAVA